MRRSAILLVALLVALGLAVGCSKARSDQDIATVIKAKMFSDPQLKTANLDVTAKNGEVTLRGEVASDAARYQAFKLATDAPGVNKVDDQMTVKLAEVAPPARAPEPAPAPAPVVRRTVRRPAAAPAPVREQAPPQSPAEHIAAAPGPPPPPPQPKHVEIAAGTSVTVRMIDSVDSEINHTGEIFHASLDAPIVVDNEIVVPTGTDVYVKLVNARSAGHMTGRSELGLELVRMQFQGKSYALISNEYQQVGTSRGKRTAATIGGGAAIGAAIGAIAGGGKGAAIGAGVGAGSGTVIQAVTKGKQIRIPSETKLDFRLEQPVEVSYFPEKNRSRR
ncbi:MAG: BON domain-containing protein [Acidobacteria bacterium]|nr:BON domain-containing protein [Acidobacteriota bacterium]